LSTGGKGTEVGDERKRKRKRKRKTKREFTECGRRCILSPPPPLLSNTLLCTLST
jgi:hypothetical protein